MSDNQHIVSQFYLRHFSVNGRLLNVYNLKRNKTIIGASLKGQCYRRNVYPPEIEKNLMDFEGRVATMLSAVIASNSLPRDGDGPTLLFLFLASQMLRTSSALNEVGAMVDMQMKHVFQPAYGMTDEETAHTRADLTEPALMLLQLVPKLAEHLEDLGIALVEPESDAEFITSDDPVIRYNAYTEGVSGASRGRGLASIGLQVFVPLSPRLLLIAFDPRVYAVSGTMRGRVASASDSDVIALNRLHAVFTMENLYFLSPGKTDFLDLARSARVHRVERKASLTSFKEQGGEQGALLVYNSHSPSLGLRLSALRVRKSAQRVPLPERFGRRIDSRPGLPTLAGKRFTLAGRVTRTLVEG